LTGYSDIYSQSATAVLIKAIDDIEPNVVHLHNLHGYYLSIPHLVVHLKKRGIKVIWTLHDELMYTGKCAHANECPGWLHECGNCPQVHEYPASLFFDRSRELLHMKRKLFGDWGQVSFVAPSRWLARRIENSILRDKPIKVIRNGIDTEGIFYPRDRGGVAQRMNVQGRKVVLAIAANLMSESKGGRFLIELARRPENRNVLFILVGVNRNAIAMPENAIALAPTNDQHAIAELYSLADVLVICSKRENFPTVCLESLACGTGVVGFDTGGTAETAPSPYGEFVKYGDVDRLQAALTRRLRNASGREQIAAFAKAQYSRDKMYSEYFCLYKGTDLRFSPLDSGQEQCGSTEACMDPKEELP
jgi:glycosyltransferase involved in cell wall biosynthesis